MLPVSPGDPGGRNRTELCTEVASKDGSTFWAGLEGVAVPGSGGDSAELRVTLSDISVRVEAEQVAERARREKEETLALLDAIFGSAPSALVSGIETFGRSASTTHSRR